MPIEQVKEGLTLEHKKGPSVQLLWYGAHILSWKSATPSKPNIFNDRLFTSSKSPLDGSMPVRGGIPIAFPAFAAPSHPDHLKMPYHGFARSEIWGWDGNLVDNEEELAIRLSLDPTPRIKAVWDKSFHLDYIISLKPYSLSTTLRVTNTSPSISFEFQGLFHTYFACPSRLARVTPLHGLPFYDKTDTNMNDGQPTKKVETSAQGVDVSRYTDAVFENGPSELQVTWPNGGVIIRTKGTKDIVVWNPGETMGRKIPEMEERGWERFVCVEPGFARSYEPLQPGKTWEGSQEITVR